MARSMGHRPPKTDCCGGQIGHAYRNVVSTHGGNTSNSSEVALDLTVLSPNMAVIRWDLAKFVK